MSEIVAVYKSFFLALAPFLAPVLIGVLYAVNYERRDGGEW